MSVKELSIKLEGLELSDKDIASLEKDVNAVVLKHIAATKQKGAIGSLTGQPAVSIGKLNPQWRGIWMKAFANKAALEHAQFHPEKTLDAHL